MKRLQYYERQIFRQEPDCYSGPGYDQLRPRWMTSYPKEGDEEDGETLKLEIPAAMMPPGSRIKIEVPGCPECGEPADMNGDDGDPHPEWPACHCGFSWAQFARDYFS